jgi:hypothetical protein
MVKFAYIGRRSRHLTGLILLNEGKKSVKRIFLVLCTIFFIFGSKGFSAAATYEDVVDWNGFSWMGRDCKVIDDSNWLPGDPYPFEYEHTVSFNPPAGSIDTAILTLSHYGNYSGWLNPELWFISADGGTFLGNLGVSGWEYGWVDQKFTLPETLFDTVEGGTWSLALKLEEGTGGCWDLDMLALDKSVLSGTYSAVPIPSTVWIFATGLMGLVGIRRKFNQT